MDRDRWSTLCKLGPRTESARRAGPPQSSWDPGANRPEELVDPAAVRIWTESAGTACDSRAPRTRVRVGRDC